jgi:hypothetical protein
MTTTTTTTTTMAMMVRILRVDVGDGVVIELMVLSSPMVVLVMWLAALLKQHCLLNTIFIRAFNVLSSLWVSPLSLSLSLYLSVSTRINVVSTGFVYLDPRCWQSCGIFLIGLKS